MSLLAIKRSLSRRWFIPEKAIDYSGQREDERAYGAALKRDGEHAPKGNRPASQ
jgi:hypothetical protein